MLAKLHVEPTYAVRPRCVDSAAFDCTLFALPSRASSGTFAGAVRTAAQHIPSRLLRVTPSFTSGIRLGIRQIPRRSPGSDLWNKWLLPAEETRYKACVGLLERHIQRRLGHFAGHLAVGKVECPSRGRFIPKVDEHGRHRTRRHGFDRR